jgi:hypothetical protein
MFSTGNFMSACRIWNEKDTAEKTWAKFKVSFAGAHRQHNQMQGGSAANPGYHAANASVGQNEDQMSEANIGALANLATVTATVLIPQVRPAHKYPNSPWETIQPPGGDNAECVYPHKVYMAECDKSLTATYQCKTPIPSNKLLVTNILTNN